MFGASSLIEKNTKPEDAANKAAKELVRDIGHGGCFDEYGADQVIIFMALATGKSKIRVGPLSLHTQTAIHFVQLLSGVRSQFRAVQCPLLINY
jgi:RNA 3'-terminal phosphate cyclase (ATP)